MLMLHALWVRTSLGRSVTCASCSFDRSSVACALATAPCFVGVDIECLSSTLPVHKPHSIALEATFLPLGDVHSDTSRHGVLGFRQSCSSHRGGGGGLCLVLNQLMAWTPLHCPGLQAREWGFTRWLGQGVRFYTKTKAGPYAASETIF